MPKIPIYEPQTQIDPRSPGTLVDTATYAIEGRSMAQIFSTVAESAMTANKTLSDINHRFEIARKTDELDNLKLDISKRLYADRDTLNNIEDPKQWQGEFEKKWNENLAAGLARTQDPLVQNALKHWGIKTFIVANHGVMQDARKQEVLNFAGNVEKKFPEYVDLALNAPDESQRQLVTGQFMGMINNAQRSLIIHPDKAEKLKAGFEQAVKIGQVDRMINTDPGTALAELNKPNAFGMDGADILRAKGRATSELHRQQNDTYNKMFGQIVQATQAEGPPQGPLPSVGEVKSLLDQGKLNAGQANNIMGYLQGLEQNPNNITNWDHYKEATVRFTEETDPETGKKPLTRKEFLTNINTGTWKLNGNHFKEFLTNIYNRDVQKIPKLEEQTVKNAVNFWKTQMDPKSEQFTTAQAQLQIAKNGGEFKGLEPDEIKEKVNSYFAEAHKEYQQVNMLGKFAPPPKDTRSWYQRMMGAPAPGGVKSQTGVTSQGQTFRVKNKKTGLMEDVTPEQYQQIMQLQKNVPGRATGGPVEEDQSYIVGEEGPELFIPDESGTIIPNPKRGGKIIMPHQSDIPKEVMQFLAGTDMKPAVKMFFENYFDITLKKKKKEPDK